MKKLLIALLVLGVLTAAIFIWRNNRNSKADGAIVLFGNIDIRQVALAFEGSGRVAELRAEEGDHVKAGAVLAVLDTRTLSLQAEEAQAKVELQQQTLARLRNGSRPEEIDQARSRLAAAKSDVEQAEQDLSRMKAISANTKGQGVSAQNIERAGSLVEVAKAKHAEQRDALRLTELGPRVEDIAAAEAQVKASQAQLALLHHQIEQGNLKAPTDAVISSRLLEPGDMASPQRIVFALALVRPKWVRVFVGERDLGKITPGMAAEIFSDSHPDQPIKGKVGYISSVAEFTPKSVQTEELRTSLVYEVRVVTEDERDQLRLGQPVTVHLANATAP